MSTPTSALHGFAGHPDLWLPLRNRARGLSLTTPRLPGHGHTPSASSWREAVDRLATSTPQLWIGYSLGARLAMALAEYRPSAVLGMAFIGGHPGLLDAAARAQREAWDHRWAERLATEELPRVMNDWAALPIFASQASLSVDLRARQRAWRLGHHPRGLASAFTTFGLGRQPDRRPALARLERPMLYVVGEHDAKYRAIAGDLAQQLPTLEVRVIDEAGHNPMLERPEPTVDAVVGWAYKHGLS